MSFQISLATKKDLKNIEALEKTFQQNYENPASFFEESILHKRLIYAEKNGVSAGYLIYQILWGNTPFLALLKVHSDFQGQKLGMEMINFLELDLKNQGFEKYLSSSQIENISGKKFHEKLGFKPMGQLEMIYGREQFFVRDL